MHELSDQLIYILIPKCINTPTDKPNVNAFFFFFDASVINRFVIILE